MKISNTNEQTYKGIKILVYGEQGKGKTFLASTLTNEKPVILSFESGLMCLQDFNIPVIDCTTDDNGNTLDEPARINKLVDSIEWLKTDEAKSKFTCVFVDSLTEVADTLEKYLSKKHENNSNNFIVWKELADKMENIVRSFRDMNYYVQVFTALEDVDKDSDGRLFRKANFPGKKTGFVVQACFDEVLRLTVDQDGKRFLQCQPKAGIIVKDRSNRLKEIEPANLQEIVDKIRAPTKPIKVIATNIVKNEEKKK